MISHEHKCIFIHISKCAGSSIEAAFGIDLYKYDVADKINLYGWDKEFRGFLQHATPQQLLGNNLISKQEWDNYYKFIIVRNPWDRSYSDYKWLMREIKKKDSFYNYLNSSGNFKECLTDKTSIIYRGDHLYKQVDYFFVNDKKINYDKVIRFEELDSQLPILAKDLGLNKDFFNKKENADHLRKKHYSKFYNYVRKKMVQRHYSEDISFLNYEFEDRKKIIDWFRFYKSSENLI